MRSRLSLPAFVLASIGFGASVASAIDYFGVQPTFCSESGCATVRQSDWSHPLGIPMPLLGLAFYALMIGLCFVEKPLIRKVAAAAGGAWAVFLIVLQASVIHAWCKLCMIADPTAIALAIVVLAGAGTLKFAGKHIAIGLPVIALLPLVFAIVNDASHEPPPIAKQTGSGSGSGSSADVPEVIAREQKPGSATIVDFVDFECPFCRRLAPKLDEAIAQAQVPVHLVRKMSPLKMHHHAMDAAIAYCCAEAQGKGDEMAKALFAAPADDLTPAGCEKIAESIGCDMDKYRQMVSDPSIKDRIVQDTADAKAAGVRGLPTVFIGKTGLGGADHDTAELSKLIQSSI
ncbi:MAG: vitamin K epoxide reductase family protein [Kofleriaceae bacterium]